MSRWNRTKRDNYVVIYKNGQLYDKYNTIEYDDISFSVNFDIEQDGIDDNVFEFVFFLNCNNTIMNVNVGNLSVPDKLDGSDSTSSNNADGVKSFINLNNAIFMNTDCFDPEEILLFTTKIPGDIVDIDDAKSNGSYLIDTEFKSYKEIDGSDRDYSGVTATLSDDFPINGIYRVNRQGKYNVPYGHRNYTHDIDKLRWASCKLQNTTGDINSFKSATFLPNNAFCSCTLYFNLSASL